MNMRDIHRDEATHTPEERDAILVRMYNVCSVFYQGAARTGCHAFIEFTGLLNEFRDICIAAEAEDVDWVMANTHNGRALPVKEHHAAYLAEKLNCIYGPSLLADERIREVFITTLFGGKFKLVAKADDASAYAEKKESGEES